MGEVNFIPERMARGDLIDTRKVKKKIYLYFGIPNFCIPLVIGCSLPISIKKQVYR